MSRWKVRRAVSELVFRLRTEAGTPVRQGFSVAVGAFIACFPLYGLHLFLVVILSRLFRLNTLKMYLVTQLNNPFVAPLLVYLDLQAGSLLRRGHVYPHRLNTLKELDIAAFAGDILLGAAVVGLFGGAAAGFAAYSIVKRETDSGPWKKLLEATSRMYLTAGLVQWEVTRAHLRLRRSFLTLVVNEALSRSGPILDMECGRGVLLALIAVARETDTKTTGEPMTGASIATHDPALRGIDRRRSSARVASTVLGSAAQIQCADPRLCQVPPSSVVILPSWRLGHIRQSEHGLVQRAASALNPGGVIVVRLRPPFWPGRRSRATADLKKQLERWGLVVDEPAVAHGMFRPFALLGRAHNRR